MNGVRSIESLAAGDGQHNLLRTLGPTLLISMGYIDLGKWVATVDAGSRFGYDLVLLVVLFNFSAILYQYQSVCIGMVTGKNLAEICHQEYSRIICFVLGLQAGLSLLTAELTMISGIAIGFNLVFEYGDVITGICFSSVVVNLLPYAVSHLDKRVAGILNACIAGFALLCFVLGLLVSQPKVPVNMNVMFPKLSGESAYSLMALLGGNVIAHNFYVHSSVVQRQTLDTTHHREETETYLENVAHEEVQWPSVQKESSESHQKSAVGHMEISDTSTESDHDVQPPAAHREINPEAHSSSSIFREELKSVEVDLVEPMAKVSTDALVEQSTAEMKSATEKIVQVEPGVCTQKVTEVPHALEFEKSLGVKEPPSSSDCPPSLTLSRGDDTDAANVSGIGILSRQSGLGRAARRQLAAILDEFWGCLFDYHGKLTQKANTKRIGLLIGLDLRAAGSAVRKDNLSIDNYRSPGITEPAFSKPRKPLTRCACLKNVGTVGEPIPGSFTTAAEILEVIKGVEQAVSCRKGRSGTAAGDVAFPKGKENLASVLKRYKRRLSSKTPARQ
nr:unnamed protein product [Digitaria exilis]